MITSQTFRLVRISDPTKTVRWFEVSVGDRQVAFVIQAIIEELGELLTMGPSSINECIAYNLQRRIDRNKKLDGLINASDLICQIAGTRTLLNDNPMYPKWGGSNATPRYLLVDAFAKHLIACLDIIAREPHI